MHDTWIYIYIYMLGLYRNEPFSMEVFEKSFSSRPRSHPVVLVEGTRSMSGSPRRRGCFWVRYRNLYHMETIGSYPMECSMGKTPCS